MNNFTSNFTNYSNYNITIKNSEDNNDLPIYIPIIIILSIFIFSGCIFTFLIHECSIKKCLCQGFRLKKIEDTFNWFYYLIYYNCCCYQDDEYNEHYIYSYNDVIIINMNEYTENNYKKNTTEYNYEEKPLQFKDELCSICIEVTEGEQITTECGHVFCKECIETHLKTSNQCPICRQIITKLYNNTIN